MAKVFCSIEYKHNLGNYQHVQISVGISDVDAEMPLEPQIERAKLALPTVLSALDQELSAKLEKVTGGGA